MSTLIKNGRVITAEQDYLADVFIENGKIKTIGQNLDVKAETILDAKGKYVIPGGVDVHTHLDMPFGGTTSIIDFATQARGTKMRDALDIWHKKAEGKAAIDYGFHMIVTDLPDA